LDKIHIKDLLIRCIIGVYERERKHKQDVLLNITLHTDVSAAAGSDDLADTIDYVALRDRILEFVQASSFQLIESIAEGAARICLATPRVHAVDVTVDKPGALTYSRSVAVQIHRSR